MFEKDVSRVKWFLSTILSEIETLENTSQLVGPLLSSLRKICFGNDETMTCKLPESPPETANSDKRIKKEKSLACRKDTEDIYGDYDIWSVSYGYPIPEIQVNDRSDKYFAIDTIDRWRQCGDMRQTWSLKGWTQTGSSILDTAVSWTHLGKKKEQKNT